MDRRTFFSSSLVAAGAAAGAKPRAAQAAPAPSVRFKLGCQSGPTTDERLLFFKRHGVNNICGHPPERPRGGYFSAEELTQLRERADRHGVSVDALLPPFLASTHIDKAERPAIMLGQSPQRDRDIEDFQNQIRACAKAGIPCVKYNMSLLGVVRTAPTRGRGGLTLSTFRLREADELRKKQTRAGRVTADIYWERISYFLERVVPVANENKVRIACHPHDPSVPAGFEGVDVVLGSVDGLKRLVSIKESPYHGLNFCQGTVSEMLDDPGREIYDVIRYFGSRQKIFNVHFRNIRGHRGDFQEVFPDEGDVDFVKAVQVYREVGYPYMLMPDHVPRHPDDPDGKQAFAFCYGYIRALIQTAERMV